MSKYSKYSLSKSEKTIIEVLIQLEKSFYIEKDFQDCKNPETGQRLRFDFYIPEDNLCIEYDGKQHYEYIAELHGDDFNIGTQRFKAQQVRDEIKTEYCKEKGINLLRIKYSEYQEIKKIIDECLKNLKK